METLEAPTPIINENNKSINSFLLNFNLKYENSTFEFNLYDINNSKIKLIAKKQNLGKENSMCEKYETQIELAELKTKNKYFKMFETYQEFKVNFIELCKANKVNIIKLDDNEINISVNLMIINDNLINLTLKKIELSQNDRIDFLIEDSKLKDKKIEELNSKIISLEKTIQNLISRIGNLEKLKNIALDKNLNLYNSKIFSNIEEISFIFSAISKDDFNKINLELLFSSDRDGENEEKLKSAYINKNDILVLIKTKENKRFGGYAHESFELNEFKKKDLKAFLFNIDKLKIYKSNDTDCSICRNINTSDSINFGGGTDLRIYHKFLTEENYTKPNKNKYYDYLDDEFALNGKKNFSIQILEIFQVKFS